MKRLKWPMISLAVLALIVAFIFFVIHKSRADKFNQINMLMSELQTRYDVDLIFFGSAKPPSYCDFKYRMIDQITEETLIGDMEGNCYHFLVMTDLFDPLEVTKEELLLLKRFCLEKGYAFGYAGTDSRDLMKDCGFWSFYSETECGFTFSGYSVSPEKSKEEFDENDYLVSCYFGADFQGSKLEAWLDILFPVESQMEYDLTDGKGLI